MLFKVADPVEKRENLLVVTRLGKEGGMKKGLVILIGMLAALLVAAVPVLAQGQITATGVLERSTRESPDPTPRYAITDEESDTSYELFDAGAGLEAYVGERVTISGTRAPGPGPPDGPLAVDVTWVTPADGPSGPPPGEDTVTLSFGLTVKGTPPEGTRFFGSAVGEGGPGTPLTDPDGDGVFTVSLKVPRFAPGGPPEPVSLPVQIVQANSGAGPCNPTTVIKDFGIIPANDNTFRAQVNFGPGGSGSIGSGNSSGGGTGKLPSTGGAIPGAIPALGLVSALLVGGGLLIRRVTR